MLRCARIAAAIGVALVLTCVSGGGRARPAAGASDTSQVVTVSATLTRDTAFLDTDVLTVTLSLPAPQQQRVSVHYAFSSDDGISFKRTSGTAAIAAGATSRTFKVVVYFPPLIGDGTIHVVTNVERPAAATFTTSPTDLQIPATSPLGAPRPGYWLITSKGSVYAFNAPFEGGLASPPTSAIVGAAETPTGNGYWLVGADGRVYAFGGATYHGLLTSTPAAPIVAIAADPATGGYWLFDKVGAVYAFDAHDYGHGSNLDSPVVAAAAAPDGRGYWIATATGEVKGFGPGAVFQGDASTSGLSSPIVGMAADPHTGGYWLVSKNGGVFAFGAPNEGSPIAQGMTVIATDIAADPANHGYWISLANGGVASFGGAKFYGSAAPDIPNAPIIAILGR